MGSVEHRLVAELFAVISLGWLGTSLWSGPTDPEFAPDAVQPKARSGTMCYLSPVQYEQR